MYGFLIGRGWTLFAYSIWLPSVKPCAYLCVSVCVCLFFQLAEVEHGNACLEIELGEKERDLRMAEGQLEQHIEQLNHVDAALPKPDDEGDVEMMEVYVKPSEKVVAAIKRRSGDMKKRREHLTKSGFTCLNSIRDTPNSRYMWKKMRKVLGKRGVMHYRGSRNMVTNKTLQSYELADNIDVADVVREMRVSAGAEWLTEIIVGAGLQTGNLRQSTLDEHLVPITPVVRPE